jgi:hypothetical protein
MGNTQLEATTTWRCDTCGQKINSANDGWAEWLRFDPEPSSGLKGHGLRLEHRPSPPG